MIRSRSLSPRNGHSVGHPVPGRNGDGRPRRHRVHGLDAELEDVVFGPIPTELTRDTVVATVQLDAETVPIVRAGLDDVGLDARVQDLAAVEEATGHAGSVCGAVGVRQ